MLGTIMDATPLPKRPEEPDDELGELPPLDGEGGDDEAHGTNVDEVDEVDDGDDEGATDLLDDSTGDGDPADEEVDAAGTEGGWLDDATDADELDVGAHDLDDQERTNLLEDADEPGVGDEDFGLDPLGASMAGDAGEEGPEGADDDLREEDLPRLDADDDGELEDEVFVDAWPLATDDERPPWDDRAWERVAGVPSIGLARSVVPLGGPAAALVGGARVLRVDATGATPAEAVGGESIHGSAIAGVARLSDGVVAATGRGVFVGAADGGGETKIALREVTGWAELAAGPLVELAAHGAHIWARTQGGALLESADRGATWAALAADGVDAVTATPDGELVAVRGGAVVRGPSLAAWGPPLPLLPAHREGSSPIVRARGAHVVVAALGAGAFRSDGGPWERLEGTGSVTAVTRLGDDGTTLVALHAAAEDRSWIARAGADGVARIVVEIGGEVDEGDDPRVLDLAWSDASRVAWAVGPFGVAILRPR